MIQTAYGSVGIGLLEVEIRATHAELYAWAHRPGALWPCSDLAELEAIRVVFNRDGLLDLDSTPDFEGMADELNAWSSDVLAGVLSEHHPAYPVAVGQFKSETP